MKISLTNSQADIQILADQLKNLMIDLKPTFITSDRTLEVYENDQWMLKVDWNKCAMFIDAK